MGGLTVFLWSWLYINGLKYISIQRMLFLFLWYCKLSLFLKVNSVTNNLISVITFFFCLLVKSCFYLQIVDDKNVRRRFRASNYQSTTRVKPFICTMPLRLDDGWNQIQFNLADFTRRAYGTNYVETLRVQVVFLLYNYDIFAKFFEFI